MTTTPNDDRARLLRECFTDKEIVCLDYVADRAAIGAITDALITHGQNCPFKAQVASFGVKAAVGAMAVLAIVGGLAWGAIRTAQNEAATNRTELLQAMQQIRSSQTRNANLAASDRELHRPELPSPQEYPVK